MNKKDSTYYLNLISRHFAGEASGEELQELAQWLKEDEVHQVVFNDYQKTWKSLEKARISKELDVERDLAQVKQTLNMGDQLENEAEKSKVLEVSFTPEEKTRPLSQLMKVAAVLMILVIPVYFVYQFFATADSLVLTASNNMVSKILPDSTYVQLNAGSTLIYPEYFGGKQRNVILKGEAWFEVKHDRNKPFVIQSEDVNVQVLGTSFYVNTKSTDQKMEVVLNTGKVAVYYKSSPDKPIVLSPNEKATVSRLDRKIVKSQNQDPNYLSWKTKKLVFDENSLAQVIAKLNKVYRSSIKISKEELNGCLVTATFEKQSLESVLAVLEATYDLQIEKKGKEYLITGGVCEE